MEPDKVFNGPNDRRRLLGQFTLANNLEERQLVWVNGIGAVTNPAVKVLTEAVLHSRRQCAVFALPISLKV